MQRPTERQVGDWLLALGRLVAANMPTSEVSERLRAYTPLLVERFDSRDFNAASREFVARNCKFFPSYGELCELLDKWPKPAEKPAESIADGSDMDAMDRSWVAFWHRRRGELFAQQSGFKWGTRDADLANLASLIQSQSSKAWEAISGVPRVVTTPPSEQAVAYVARLLRPERESVQKPGELPEPPPPPLRDVTLKGEALRQSRERSGLIVP